MRDARRPGLRGDALQSVPGPRRAADHARGRRPAARRGHAAGRDRAGRAVAGSRSSKGRCRSTRSRSADEAFLTNSVRGMLPVARLLARRLARARAGDATPVGAGPRLARIGRHDAMTTVADVAAWLEQFAPSRPGRAVGQRRPALGRSGRGGRAGHDLPDGHADHGRRGDPRAGRADRQPPSGAVPRDEADPGRPGRRPAICGRWPAHGIAIASPHTAFDNTAGRDQRPALPAAGDRRDVAIAADRRRAPPGRARSRSSSSRRKRTARR